MVTVRKYMFDADFTPVPENGDAEAVVNPLDNLEEVEQIPLDEPPQGEAVQEEPPPIFGEEDMAAAKEQAFEAGRAAGLEEAHNSETRFLTQIQAELAAALRQIGDEQEKANRQNLTESVEIVQAIVQKLFPELVHNHGIDEIIGVVRECVSKIDRPARVTIRVNPQAADALREKVEETARQTGFEGKLVFASDPRIKMGDCRVEWGDGGAERDQGRILEEIEATIARTINAEKNHAAQDAPDQAVELQQS